MPMTASDIVDMIKKLSLMLRWILLICVAMVIIILQGDITKF